MKCNVSRDHCYSWWTNGHLWDHLIMLNGKLCEVFFFFFLINITSLITSFLSKLSGKDTLELCVMSKQYVDKESYLSMCLSSTTNLKFGHPWAKSTLSPKSEVLAWEGSPHSKWIPSLDTHFSVKGHFFRELITLFVVSTLT